MKLLLSPALIGVASVVGRRWGPRAGGWFTALPLTSGPVMLVLSLEQGPAFAARACAGASLAIVSLAAYGLVYSWVAPRAGWATSGLLACGAFLSSTWLLRNTTVPLTWSFGLACAVLGVAIRMMPNTAGDRSTAPTMALDIPLRMLLAASVIWLLARVASAVGPTASGLLAPFPIAATILAAFTHHVDGPGAVQLFLRSLLAGLFSFAVFLLVAGTGLERGHIGMAFNTAILATLMTHLLVWRSTRSSRSTAEQPGVSRG